jgi:hypothetical protein
MNPFKISDKVVCVSVPIDWDAPLLFIGRVYVVQEVGDGWIELVGHVDLGDGINHCFRPQYFRKLEEMKERNRLLEELIIN